MRPSNRSMPCVVTTQCRCFSSVHWFGPQASNTDVTEQNSESFQRSHDQQDTCVLDPTSGTARLRIAALQTELSLAWAPSSNNINVCPDFASHVSSRSFLIRINLRSGFMPSTTSSVGRSSSVSSSHIGNIHDCRFEPRPAYFTRFLVAKRMYCSQQRDRLQVAAQLKRLRTAWTLSIGMGPFNHVHITQHGLVSCLKQRNLAKLVAVALSQPVANQPCTEVIQDLASSVSRVLFVSSGARLSSCFLHQHVISALVPTGVSTPWDDVPPLGCWLLSPALAQSMLLSRCEGVLTPSPLPHFALGRQNLQESL